MYLPASWSPKNAGLTVKYPYMMPRPAIPHLAIDAAYTLRIQLPICLTAYRSDLMMPVAKFNLRIAALHQVTVTQAQDTDDSQHGPAR